MITAIDFFQGAAIPVAKQIVPGALRISGDQGIRVLQGFIRQKGRVVTAHDHAHALRAKPVGQLVRAARRERLHTQRHQIGIQFARDFLHLLIVEAYVMLAGARREYAHRQRRHGIGRTEIAHVRPDERNLHSTATSGCTGL